MVIELGFNPPEPEPELPIGSPIKTGEFVRNYLLEHSSASASIIHIALKDYYREFRTQKKKKYHVATYHSFKVYINGLVRAGLVEKSGRSTRSTNPKGFPLQNPALRRRNVKLTDKGRDAPLFVWAHPIRIWHYPLDWERVDYGEYIKEGA